MIINQFSVLNSRWNGGNIILRNVSDCYNIRGSTRRYLESSNIVQVLLLLLDSTSICATTCLLGIPACHGHRRGPRRQVSTEGKVRGVMGCQQSSIPLFAPLCKEKEEEPYKVTSNRLREGGMKLQPSQVGPVFTLQSR